MHHKTLIAAGTLACVLPLCSHATEGALGRPITAQQISSNAGIVPPEPGWAVSVTSINYKGDIGASRQVPLAGQVSAGIDASTSYNLANLTRIWDTGSGSWNFASSVAVPLQYLKVKASVAVGPLSTETSQSETGISDLLITPIIAGKHFSKTEHMSLSLPIYVPSADYDSNRLANLGQNMWTFMPTIAYTKLSPEGGEFTAMGMLQLYTKNKDTDYRNGAILVTEALWTTRIAKDTNLGIVGGLIYQLADDKGPTADRLDGFKGHAIGLGPVITWSGKIGNSPGSLSARWVSDVDTKNRPKGNSFGLSMSLLFM